MTAPRWLTRPENLLPVVLGLTDGILTALTLTAGLLTRAGDAVTLGLAARIAAGALASGAFVFFVARYAELRRELIRAERELNLTAHGRFATGRLGRAALRDALLSSAISSLAAFVGALVPLVAAAIFPGLRWASIVAALIALALLGVGLARAAHGRAVWWCMALVAGGVALSGVGAALKIVG